MAKKKAKKSTKKKLPIIAGIQMIEIGEKKILNPDTARGKPEVRYHCRFEDGSFKMVKPEIIKNFIK